jgi:transposase
VHKKTVTGSVITPDRRETRTFGTMTCDLLELRSWLQENHVTHVAMESTGVYWKPIYNLLEESGIEALVVNAHHIKQVPGRKTDVKDAVWIADLLRHGLVRGSFIPDRHLRELRELVRYRRSLIGEQASETNRIQKVLEGANIKLGDVTSVVLGVSGRQMLKAIIAGETSPKELASLARGRLRSKRDALEHALTGLVGPHQRWMLAAQLAHVEFLEGQIGSLDQEIAERMRPFDEVLERMSEIDGLARRTCEEILAEIGVDMSRFATHRHLASWAKICPGNNQSAGIRKSGQTGKGNAHLQSALVRAAQAASHTRDTYLSAQYHRLASRRGRNRAKVAVAHSILVIIYHVIKHGTHYYNLGAGHFDRLREQATVDRAVARLQGLGYKVSLEKTDAAA